MRFKDIIGHEKIKNMLSVAADNGRISHAQLFEGDSGRGSLALAHAYAQYIMCTNRHDGDSCGECASCRKVSELVHPDLNFVFPVNSSKKSEAGASDNRTPVSDHFISVWREIYTEKKGYFSEQDWYREIEIDNKQGNISRAEATEIIKKMNLKPYESKYKIMIIWLPERMNAASANALLKLIEEPWDNCVFIMVTNESDKIMQTILSRSQITSIPQIESSAIKEYLIEEGTPEDKADIVSKLSCGNLLQAQSLLSSETEEDENFELFVSLMRLSYENRHLELFDWAERVASMSRESQKKFIENTLRLIRESYILSIHADQASYLYGKEKAFCVKFAPYVNNGNVEEIIANCESVLADISQNGNPRIVFTHFALAVSKLIGMLNSKSVQKK